MIGGCKRDMDGRPEEVVVSKFLTLLVQIFNTFDVDFGRARRDRMHL